MPKKGFLFAIVFVFGAMFSSKAQDFYDPSTVQEINIKFRESNWDEILDGLYVAGFEERLEADIEINGTELKDVGVRYKGFSSVSTDRAKNPFNIKLNYTIDDQEYDGIDKIKLSNVIQDPSFVREVLSYEIARKYMPASRANFAKVFINGVYWGLYTNVEAVDGDFLSDHFSSNDGSFFKCNPEDLDLDVDAENANLGNSLGTNIDDYHELYDLKSDKGWNDLYDLIEILNEKPESLPLILNVDQTLWMHAFNYALVNFDSYIGYAQNYYLYQDQNEQFVPILWDLNMSFGSFRFSDASEYYDGFTIEQAKTIDPLSHYNSVSVSPRPLMRNLFEDDTYRRMYLAHLKTIVEENFQTDSYYKRAQFYQELTDTHVKTDTNKFYTYSDFRENLDSTVSDLIDYPGIKDLVEGRTTYLNDYLGQFSAPEYVTINQPTGTFSIGDEIGFTVEMKNAQSVLLNYRYGDYGLFSASEMIDDGQHNDGTAGDGIYGISITASGSNMQYYFYSENDEAGLFSPKRAAYEFYNLPVNLDYQNVVINELMAGLQSVRADENGDYDDWIEFYNTSAFDLNMSGLFLSDNKDDLQQWAFPDEEIGSGSYLMVWADNQPDEGRFHCNFSLEQDGESIYLSDDSGRIIDSITYGPQSVNISFGRSPNGLGEFTKMTPSYFAQNPNIGNLASDDFRLFPNPTNSSFSLILQSEEDYSLELFSANGQIVTQQTVDAHDNLVSIDLSEQAHGVYVLRLSNNDHSRTRRVLKY